MMHRHAAPRADVTAGERELIEELESTRDVLNSLIERIQRNAAAGADVTADERGLAFLATLRSRELIARASAETR